MVHSSYLQRWEAPAERRRCRACGSSRTGCRVSTCRASSTSAQRRPTKVSAALVEWMRSWYVLTLVPLCWYFFLMKKFGQSQFYSSLLLCSQQLQFTQKHRSGRSRWSVPDNFPDPLVARAYLHPQAQYSTEPFAFSAPLRGPVRRFCSDRLGWTDAQVRYS